MLRSICVLLLVCGCDESPAEVSPPPPPVRTEPVTTIEVESTPQPPKPQPPSPSRPSLDPNLDLVAALRPIEPDEGGGIAEDNDRYFVSLSWPRFQFADSAIRDALDSAIRPIAGDGTLYEDGDGEEDGRCESRLSRAGFVSVTCYTFRSFEPDDGDGVEPGGCDIPVVGKTWHIVDGQLLEIQVGAAFTSHDDLRRVCRAEVETLDVDPANRGLCSRDPLQLVLADEGVVVLPDEACTDASSGVLLSFDQVAPYYEPTSALLRVLRGLQAEADGADDETDEDEDEDEDEDG